jgi:7-keto-8-aminopelargonate synthetase-like enzyme
MAGAPQAAMDLAARLLDAGVFAPAMRPPTVPAGQCRLRLSAMATHTDEDIRRLVEALGTAEDQPAHPART